VRQIAAPTKSTKENLYMKATGAQGGALRVNNE